MDCELDIIDGLNALSYEGAILQNDVLVRALEGGPRCQEFRQAVGWLAHELHVLRKTDEHVGELEDPNEFAMELSAMLKELGCPYARFVTGPLSERFDNREVCSQVLDYLITELMATKMSLKLRPSGTDETYIIPKFETNTARALEKLTQDLGLGKPPENIAPKAFFDKMNFKVEELQRKVKPGVLGDPLLHTKNPLSDDQWQKLEAINDDLNVEYDLRRQMLLTRLDCTIQSFQWSDCMKTKEKEIVNRFEQKMKDLEPLRHGGGDTSIVALLAARSDLAVIEKTSSANVRKNTASKVQKHIIGNVPDRGGRAHEHAPPPPEMPSWQQQRATGPPGGGGGGNFRGGRGGGGGDRGGGGGRGGGHWQQYSSGPQHQHQQQQQQQQYHQQFDQRAQFNNQGRDQNWVSGRDQHWVGGSGRVQGSGWTQKGNDYERGGFHNGGNAGRGGDHSYRGRSNYNRGGGGGNRR